MKQIIYTTALFILTMTSAKGQVAIGKTSLATASAILDFDNAETNKKGIILSAVDNVDNALASITASNNGTFLFDKSDNKIKMYENDTWVSLSDMTGKSESIIVNNSVESPNNQGAIIGKQSSDAKGVLVLESPDKALVLPWIQNPHITVKNPYPGMMCYDTFSRSLAVFDGSSWNYWK